tara:strand:- start:7523 stop:8086 length:564 start_codon:yes stop_codon:yes gene_type:complete
MIQTSSPTSFPVSIQQAKTWLKIDDNNSDAEIAGLIQAATLRAEAYCGRPFIQREYTEYFDKFPIVIEPEVVTFQSLTSLSYTDGDGANQTFTDTQIGEGSKFKKARIEPAYNFDWPSTRDDSLDAVKIVYQAGYGANWNYVPETVKQAILYFVGHYFINRMVVGDNLSEIPETAKVLLADERVHPL